MDNLLYDVIIIGGGPAGATAALYTARARLKTLVIDKGISLGALGMSSEISNYPGTNGPVKGIELLSSMIDQAKSFGAEFVNEKVIGAQLKSNIKTVFINSGDMYEAKSIILATGSMGKSRTIPGEEEFIGKGVSYCATCDAAFYKDKITSVIGNNDEAFEEAFYLTKFSSKIYLLISGKINEESEIYSVLVQNSKIEIINYDKINEIQGKDKVENIVYFDNNKNEKQITTNGVFIYLQGNKPITDYLQGELNLQDDGCIVVNRQMETEIAGVYAIGDMICKNIKQAVIAAADGAIAAIQVDKFINKRNRTKFDWKK